MENRSVSGEETLRYVDDTIDGLETERLEGFERALKFQMINQVMLESEIKRLTKKKGKGHIVVQELKSDLAFKKDMINVLELQINLTRSFNQPFDEDSWQLQGMVTRENNNDPLPGVVVSIAVEKGEQKSSQWTSTTDESGVYSISIDKKDLTKLKGMKLALFVTDRNKKIIYRDNKTFIATAGVIDLENIVVGKN